MQNPKQQRNSRGRQQRSNQQHVPQNAPSATTADITTIAPPSSQVAFNQARQTLGTTEFFPSYGDSVHFMGNNNNREQLNADLNERNNKVIV